MYARPGPVLSQVTSFQLDGSYLLANPRSFLSKTLTAPHSTIVIKDTLSYNLLAFPVWKILAQQRTGDMAPTVAAFHHHNNPFHSPGYSMSGATQIHASYAGWGASTPSSPGATSPPVQQHPWQPYPQQQPTLTPSAGALVLYNPQSLFGLYYNEHLHGPFATGMGVNPFTPGAA